MVFRGDFVVVAASRASAVISAILQRERINNSLDATPFVVFESGTRFLFRSGGKTIGSGGHANPAKHLESALTSNKSSRTTFRLRPSSLSNRERTSIVLLRK